MNNIWQTHESENWFLKNNWSGVTSIFYLEQNTQIPQIYLSRYHLLTQTPTRSGPNSSWSLDIVSLKKCFVFRKI